MKDNTSYNSAEKLSDSKPLEPISEWIRKQTFTTTADIQIPDRLLEQVIGQDKAVEVVRKAAEQKRHVMLIGDPGTGKSMVARAMTEFLPNEELEDIIAYPNPEDTNTPHIRVVPGGKAKEIVKAQRAEAKKRKEQQSSMITTIVFMIVALSILAGIAPALATGNWENAHMEYAIFGIIAAVFGTLVAVVIGFAFWDRKTIIEVAKKETIKEIEKEGKLADLIISLRKLAQEDSKLREVLKTYHLL